MYFSRFCGFIYSLIVRWCKFNLNFKRVVLVLFFFLIDLILREFDFILFRLLKVFWDVRLILAVIEGFLFLVDFFSFKIFCFWSLFWIRIGFLENLLWSCIWSLRFGYSEIYYYWNKRNSLVWVLIFFFSLFKRKCIFLFKMYRFIYVCVFVIIWDSYLVYKCF